MHFTCPTPPVPPIRPRLATVGTARPCLPKCAGQTPSPSAIRWGMRRLRLHPSLAHRFLCPSMLCQARRKGIRLHPAPTRYVFTSTGHITNRQTPVDASVPPEATAVDPLIPARDSFGERPLKKSRSTYFGEPGSTELASSTASGLPVHPMLKSASTEALPPTHPPVTRYLPMRHRNLVSNFSLGSSGIPYAAEYDSLRHTAASRRPATGYVPPLSRDGKTCARLDSARHTAMPVPNGPTSGLEYDEMTQNRSIEEDAR